MGNPGHVWCVKKATRQKMQKKNCGLERMLFEKRRLVVKRGNLVSKSDEKMVYWKTLEGGGGGRDNSELCWGTSLE